MEEEPEEMEEGSENFEGALPDGYQERLLALVEELRLNPQPRSLRELCREMGNEVFVSRISRWKKTTFTRRIRNDMYESFAKVDHQGRSPNELRNLVERGSDYSAEEKDLDDISIGIEPVRALRAIVWLKSDGFPVHVMIDHVLQRHGHTLDNSGIDFFIEKTSAKRDQSKLIINRYLNRQQVSAESMLSSYPAIAAGINRLMDCYFINGDELKWLEAACQQHEHSSVGQYI
ncbi:MAG: hypothetical protein AAGA75_23835 [Cyanobacteria bacterium P01_E01_bin.6]